MPQGPIAIKVAPPSTGKTNISAAAAIKAAPGVLAKVIVNAVGSGGNLTLNDCAATGDAAAGNQIITIPQADLTVGQIIDIFWPCKTGITLSAIPSGGGIVAISYS
jgi:hypothetical protein